VLAGLSPNSTGFSCASGNGQHTLNYSTSYVTSLRFVQCCAGYVRVRKIVKQFRHRRVAQRRGKSPDLVAFDLMFGRVRHGPILQPVIKEFPPGCGADVTP